MILGIGVDLFDTDRLRRELDSAAWKPDEGVFTAREVEFCATSPRRYAICFAAKEAALKALGVGGNLERFRQIEVVHSRDGQYTIQLQGAVKSHADELGVHGVWLSVAQDSSQTGAMVIVER